MMRILYGIISTQRRRNFEISSAIKSNQMILRFNRPAGSKRPSRSNRTGQSNLSVRFKRLDRREGKRHAGAGKDGKSE